AEKYQILTLLGSGAMGSVYLGFDTILQREVAIKVLPPSSIATASYTRRLRRELHLAAMLDHPTICPLYDLNEQSVYPFIVMQYVKGETLRRRLDRGVRKEDLLDLIEIAIDVAKGLDAAHKKGIIHRDIKPANIMIPPGAIRALVMDFGLAKQ